MIFGNDVARLRLKWAFESCKNGAWGDEPDGENDAICIRAADFNADLGTMLDTERTLRAIDEATYQKVGLRSGDLVIEKSGGGEKQLVGRSVVYRGADRAVCSNFLARCRPSDLVTSEYLNYLMLAIYKARGTYPHIKQTTGIQNLDMASLLNTRVSLPPRETQKRIAAFLDEKTAQIDVLIGRKKALLKSLAEKRQVIITQAVTAGLNSTAPMKDSGVDWLGRMPAHWKVKRLSRLNDDRRPICYGIVLPGPHFEGGVPIIKGGDVRPERLKRELLNCTDPEIDAANPRARVEAGDLVYTIRGSFGDVEIVPPELAGCNLTQDTARISPIDDVDPNWLVMALKSSAVRENLAAGSLGATIRGINIFDLRRALLPVPPPTEQRLIADNLIDRTKSLDGIRERVENSTRLLSEYRAVLITAAVTGRIGTLQ